MKKKHLGVLAGILGGLWGITLSATPGSGAADAAGTSQLQQE